VPCRREILYSTSERKTAGYEPFDLDSPSHVCPSNRRERIFVELMTSDHKLKASREGSK